MKRILLVAIASFGLVGCAYNAGGSGRVDCYSIQVKGSMGAVLNGTYQTSYSWVFEYKNEKGQTLYTNERYLYVARDPEKGNHAADTTIRAYPNRFTNDYVEYCFNRFVGFVTVENNFYYDPGSRTIDSETKWSECKYESDPTTLEDGMKANNKEAYDCAKRNYYQETGRYSSQPEYFDLRLDLTESSLERHTYIQLGNDAIVTYTAKWF